jgi:hypothetical protein
MAYEQLPIVEVDLDELLLDLDNYRIPTRRVDEAGALKYLFASEDVLGAARLILRDGYFDNEVPIVTACSPGSNDPQFTVLEGNRRVSALKALHDPTLVPGHESELRSLLKRYAVEVQNLPSRVRVIVAPDRATAAPHIARLHTGIPKRRWSRDQQATFYYSLIDDLTTVDDVKAQYPDVDVVRFIKMAVMRRFLVAVPFSDPSLRQYAASDDLAMSVFEYAYRNKDIADVIGVDFDKTGQLRPRSSTPEKIAARLPRKMVGALEFLLNELRSGRLNTRSPEFKKHNELHQGLVGRLNNNFPEIRTSFQDSASLMAEATSTSPTRDSQSDRSAGPESKAVDAHTDSSLYPERSGTYQTRGPNHPDTKRKLDLSGLDYSAAPLNLKLRYFELRKISLPDLPIAAAILMRSILESTIKIHFESSPDRISGELNSVFKQVVDSYGQEKALKTTVNIIRSGNSRKCGSIQWFNLIAHSADGSVGADDVRQAWKVVNPLLRRLLASLGQGSDTDPS